MGNLLARIEEAGMSKNYIPCQECGKAEAYWQHDVDAHTVYQGDPEPDCNYDASYEGEETGWVASCDHHEYAESKTNGGIMSEQQGNLFSQDYNPTPFIAEPQDYVRWSKQVKKIFDVLKDGIVHTRQELVNISGAKNPTSRVSDLRKSGYDIQCLRVSDMGASTFQILAFVGYDTTGRHRCPTCTCKSGSKE